MIYEFEKKEGFYLVSELEKLRKKKRHDKLVMKCDEASNLQVKNFKRMYILDNSVNKILYDAQHYYLYINNNDVTLCLTYDACRIAYCIRTESDWKIISVEFLPPSRIGTKPCSDQGLDRILNTTLTTILSFTYALGFSRVFETRETGQMQKLFTSIINKEFAGDRPETNGQIESKIAALLMKNAMRREFVEKYLLQSSRPF